MTDETTMNETKETTVNETDETTGQPTSANPREVSKALKAGGRRPRNGERRDGAGGFQASAEHDGRVRVAHRFGPEADAMEPGEIADLRSCLHDEYAGILRRAGYPVADREPGAPVFVWGRDTSKDTRPTVANVRALLAKVGMRQARRRKADSTVVSGVAVSSGGTGSAAVVWDGPEEERERNLDYAADAMTRAGWTVTRDGERLTVKP